MPRFEYMARDLWGNSVHGEEEAPAESVVLRLLQSRDLTVTKLVPAQPVSKADKRRVAKMHERIRSEDLLYFIQQTSVLLEVGVPFIRTLELISSQVESRRLAETLKDIQSDVRAGMNFQSALTKHPKIFPSLWSYLIEAGEASGDLPSVLKRLGQYMERNLSLRKKVATAMVYPSILIGGAVVAVLIFMIKIIPVFSTIFANFNAKLPPFTLAVMNISSFLQHNLLQLIFFTCAAVYGFKAYGKTTAGRKTYDRLLIDLPLVGAFARDAITARIAMNLAALLKSGVSILQALDIVARASGNVIFEAALNRTVHDVRQGKTLASGLEGTGFFSFMVVNMIATGEESGRLAYMIEKVADQYEEKVDTFIARLGTLIEPAILLIMGTLIGALVVAMFLPIFSLTSAIR